MNRAQRRSQEKGKEREVAANPARQISTLLAQGLVQQKEGKFDRAEALFQQALDYDPQHPDGLHLIGLLAYRQGQWPKALEYLTAAIQNQPTNPSFHFNLGIVLQASGQTDEATSAYCQAIKLNPTFAAAHNNLGNVYKGQGRFDRAIASYGEALRVNPSYSDAHNNLGTVLREEGRFQEALAAFAQSLELSPNNPEALFNSGLVLQEFGEWAQAVSTFQKAVEQRPTYAKAYHSLGVALLWLEQLDAALDALRTSANLMHNHQRPIRLNRVHHTRIRHDAAQIEYLRSTGVLSSEYDPYLEGLRNLNDRSGRSDDDTGVMSLSESDQRALAPSFNRILHYSECSALPNGALNPELDVDKIEQRYVGGTPEIIYVDQLLRDEALQSLRRFCLESTIWKQDYGRGYVGAFFGEGFSSPLLLQLSEELRLKFPRIFRDHRLKQAWAYKYDSTRSGINIHADAAAVNVNFWITPDEANLDATSGGLVLWDKEAPEDWNFKDFNNPQQRDNIFEFLNTHEAHMVRVPYKANRAVIFNSDLFHETDEFHFGQNYTERRINITMLYGHRRRKGGK